MRLTMLHGYKETEIGESKVSVEKRRYVLDVGSNQSVYTLIMLV